MVQRSGIDKSSTTPDPGYQWESENLQLHTTNESQEVSPFPAGDQKAHINRPAQRHNKHKAEKKHNDPQKKYRLRTVSKNIPLEGLKQFYGANFILLKSNLLLLQFNPETLTVCITHRIPAVKTSSCITKIDIVPEADFLRVWWSQTCKCKKGQ